MLRRAGAKAIYVARECTVPFFDSGDDSAELVPMDYVIVGIKSGSLTEYASGITVVEE